MTKKVVENEQQQAVTGVEAIWDSWLNSFKSLQGVQNDIEKKSLEVFAYQRDLLEAARKSLYTAENESKKMAEEWNEKLEGIVKSAEKNQSELSSSWLSAVKEINEKALALSWNPSHSLFDLFSQTQDQLEATVKEAMKQQDKGRDEALKQIEGLTEQVKKTHKEILETVSV
ncbi:hypothetical protein [Sporosarcina ureilytica]|uniref:Polyhydroxyalkanoic acid inclusion protein PhaP n=1 Tax=Sporosarcina ureilytica TaxID=298596 RepID=A0A1D8JFN3_9BACL|nr:hypothetical protein [Sporosarcina ureilytica]AOV07520.1 hypothetical protein BI350_08225 [Sporosarcina ureilytica]